MLANRINPIIRITSYNVCYTKLLRLGALTTGKIVAGFFEVVAEIKPSRIVKQMVRVLAFDILLMCRIVEREVTIVITSYSIHYTKLYEEGTIDSFGNIAETDYVQGLQPESPENRGSLPGSVWWSATRLVPNLMIISN